MPLRPSMPAPWLTLALLVGLVPGGVPRGRGHPGPGPVPQPDSGATLRGARRAQASFESYRRQHVLERDVYPAGACDLHFGRFCFWYGDRKYDSVPEPGAIREARGRLLGELAAAAARLPGDDWIAGQRVRYLLEDGRLADAVALAHDCRGTPWWCTVLAGLALHGATQFASADSAFAAALGAMPEEERCRWRDVSALLPSELRGRYERMTCEERTDFEGRWWWLVAPLASGPGNDRRTEHFARLTLARIESESRTAFNMVWGDDLREMLLRFGPDVFWSRRPSSALSTAEVQITGYDREPAFHFVPSAHAFADPGRAKLEDWAPADAHPGELYAPPYAERFLPLEAQIAAFRRGDSCLVAGVYDVSADPSVGHQPARTALVLARTEAARVVSARETHLDGRQVLTATAACAPEVASLEIVGTNARWVARLRQGIEPPGRDAVSDLLLLDPTDSVTRDLQALLPHALPSARVPVGRVGLYWEVPGIDSAGDPVSTSLAVTAEPRSWLGRRAESLGLARRHRGVELSWEEVLRSEGGIAARVLDLDLSALATGRYWIELSVSVAGAVPVRATREVELVER